jgi:hypothetical protein
MYAARARKMVDHCVHRYSVYVAEKPPMTGPRPAKNSQLAWHAHRDIVEHYSQGPKNGAITTTAPGAAILWGSKRSATVPAPTARHGAPAIAAKVRHTSSPAKVSEKPAPRMKSIYRGMLTL